VKYLKGNFLPLRLRHGGTNWSCVPRRRRSLARSIPIYINCLAADSPAGAHRVAGRDRKAPQLARTGRDAAPADPGACPCAAAWGHANPAYLLALGTMLAMPCL
jgi:hypothetical protein